MRRSHASPQHWTRSLNALSFFPATCWLRVTAFAVAGASLLGHAAEGPVASVQRSLKEQQFYYGEVTGKLDEETRAALRRYQIHQGIPVSAEMDTATLQALQSSAGEPAAEPEPETNEPAAERSVRGRAQSLVQDDREFLDQLEEPREPIAEAPAQKAPRPEPEVRRPTPEVERTPPPPPPVTERTPRPSSDFPGPAEPQRQPELEPASLNPNEARRFVENYLDAAEQPTPDEEVSFFADKVDYFDSGKVSRRFIEKDQRNYYRRWTSRSFELIGQPEVLKASDTSATIRFRVKYANRGKGGSASGKTEEIMRLQRDGDSWRIAGIRERKLPN